VPPNNEPMKPTKISRACFFATAVLVAVLTLPARSNTIVWTNSAGGNWSNATNWSPNQVPGVADDVFIATSGVYSVTMDVSPTVNSLMLGGSGQATLDTSGNNLTLNSPSMVARNGVLVLNGSLGGAGPLTVNGLLDWTGGQLNAWSALTVGPNALLNIAGSVTLNGVLTNSGTIIWTTGDVEVNNDTMDTDGGIVNLAGAVFIAQNDQFFNQGIYWALWFPLYGYFNNAGLFVKTGGAGATTVNLPFNNTGMVEVDSGTVAFTDEGVGTGEFILTENGGVAYGGVFFTGAGTYPAAWNGSAITVSGYVPSVVVNSNTLNLNGSISNSVLNGGTLNVSGSISNLTWSGGDLGGSVMLAGSGSWTDGLLNGGSVLTVAPNAVLNVTNSVTLYGVLTNAGTVNWAGTGDIQIYNDHSDTDGGIVNLAGAVFNVQNDQSINNYLYWGNFLGWAGDGYFNNSGLFVKTAGAGTTTVNAIFNNAGTVEADSGTVALTDEGVGTGEIILTGNGGFAYGGVFFMGAGTYPATWNGGTITVSGNLPSVENDGNTLNLNGNIGNAALSGGTLNMSGSVSNLTWSGGDLDGSVTLAGSGSWMDGQLSGGSALMIGTNAVLNIVGSAMLNGVLTNAGTINWTGMSDIQINNDNADTDGGIVNLAGAVFNVLNDQSINKYSSPWWAGDGYFNNSGLFMKTAGADTTTVNAIFNNTGTVEVDSGTMSITDGGMGTGEFILTGSGGVAYGGAFFTGAGVYPATWNGDTITVNGCPPSVMVNGNTLNLNGNISNATLSGGTLDVSGSISNLTWSGGNLGGSVTLVGCGSWAGGQFIGGSALTVATNSVLNIVGSVTLNGVLTNAGVVNWTGMGDLEVFNDNSDTDGGIVNLAGAVFNVQNDQSINNYLSSLYWLGWAGNKGAGYFNNAGLFVKSPTMGTTTISLAVSNSGTIGVQSGTIALETGYSLANGTLSFGINSLTNYGAIRLSGSAALAGTVSASLENGYQPISGNSFAVLSFGSGTGMFADAILPFADAWQTNYSATNFTLVVLNARPSIAPITNQSVDELTLLSVAASDSDLDIPPQTLIFSLPSAPVGMTINPVTGLILWTPTQTQSPSTNTVSVSVADNGVPPLSITNVFTVVVKEVNVMPISSLIPAQSVFEFSHMTVSNTATDTDIHATVTYGLVNSPDGVTINSNGVITWTPQANQGPSTNTIVTVVRSSDLWDAVNPELSATNSFIVVVKPQVTLSGPTIVGDGSLKFSFNTVAESNYTVEYSTNLMVWNKVVGFIGDGSPVILYVPTGGIQGFYRIWQSP